jgi:hypothetical protein
MRLGTETGHELYRLSVIYVLAQMYKFVTRHDEWACGLRVALAADLSR